MNRLATVRYTGISISVAAIAFILLGYFLNAYPLTLALYVTMPQLVVFGGFMFVYFKYNNVL